MSKLNSILALPLVLYCSAVVAEFYVWYDDNGVKHISNIPRNCISENKLVILACNPDPPSEEVRQAREDEAKLKRLRQEYEALLNKYRTTARRGMRYAYDETSISGATLYIIRQEIGFKLDDIYYLEDKIIESKGGKPLGKLYGGRFMEGVELNIELTKLAAEMEAKQREKWERSE